MMKSYEFLSHSHRKAFEEFNRDIKAVHGINYYCAPALISINGAIIEGLIRSFLVELLEFELDSTYKKKVGKITTAMLQKARYDVEHQGGWEKLNQQYSLYIGQTIKDIVGDDDFRSLSILFKLRNVFSHGTCAIEPLDTMADEHKEYYPYKWQTKMQDVNSYCKEKFGNDSYVDAVAIYEFPIHFFEVSKRVATNFGENFKGLHDRVYEVVHEINVVDFGRKKLYAFL